MKLLPTLTFILLTICSTNILSMEDFYQEHNQPRNAQGSQKEYIQFLKTGRCPNCNLKGFDLRKIVEKYKNLKIDLSYSDCSGANLSNVDLSEATFTLGRFDNADFKNSDLTKVIALGAYFKYASMQKSKLIDANFFRADLSEANLKRGNINRADFSFAILHNVNFYAVQGFQCANFAGADFGK